jgi:hypothetical protein
MGIPKKINMGILKNNKHGNTQAVLITISK